MAPSRAIAVAGPINSRTMPQSHAGSEGAGKPDGMASGPNLLPIVATAWASPQPDHTTNSVAASMTMIEPGMKRRPRRGQRRIEARQTMASPSEYGLAKPIWPSSHGTFSMNSRGTPPSVGSPAKSGICVMKMTTAMPVVNPLVTGHGMNLISVPSRARPMMTRITPAIMVATSNPV